ncbi:MAG: M1 family metallopeptidase [Rhodothermia bacterium]|nr:MAG: M1 family metallopeptidase [Rhodothermia bacterium]
MLKITILILAVASCFQGAYARQATLSEEPLSDRLVAYTMVVALDPDSKSVSATQRLTWRNPDRVPVDELQFHLYLNAFKDENSTFMKESGGIHRGFTAGDQDPWGGIDITRMRIATDPATDVSPSLAPDPGSDLLDRIRFIHPDDENELDQTVVAVSLPYSVQPGESITLDIDFESRLPEIFSRTGWKTGESGNPFFMVAQWFPKIAVYEIPGQRFVPEDAPRGAWNAHQFHKNSEFYADFGTYDVTISVPETYALGATGFLESEEITDGIRTVRYIADDVHDFAWTASPDFLVYTDQWEHVAIRLLLQPAHEAQAQRYFDAAKVAFKYYADWVGEYPYTTLTLVDGIGGANGMEYPTLITGGTVYRLPEWVRALELVTIHEFGHQYFYGLLASNEFEEAWLDEGVNSYIETRLVDAEYGPGSVIDFAGLQFTDTDAQRIAYTKNNPSRGALFTNSWEYQFGDYSKASYMKPATVLHTLERYLGWETMREFLRTYYDTWRFRHPTTRDLQDVAESVSGKDLDWFFDQFVYGTATFDYKIHSLSNRRIGTADENDSVTYESRVIIVRTGDGVFPQTLRATFRDGSEEIRHWSGEDSWTEMVFQNEERLVEAFIDPENQVLLDTNRLNNRQILRVDADNSLARTAQLRLTSFIQQLLIVFSGIF